MHSPLLHAHLWKARDERCGGLACAQIRRHDDEIRCMVEVRGERGGLLVSARSEADAGGRFGRSARVCLALGMTD
jgi:hypothetical protein